MAQVLCVGIATLDIINQVEHYPVEDSEVRAVAQSQRMGGNAANTAIVLAQLGNRVTWVGNLPMSSDIIDHSFGRHGVDASHAVRIDGAVIPTSYISLSTAKGTRSIVHFRDMPEYGATSFAQLDLRPFDWVHFEGRAVEQLAPMMRLARNQSGLTISLEIEKPRPGIEALFDLPDLLMFSHDYATARGYSDAPALLNSVESKVVASCTWGSQGAWAVDANGELHHATPPVLDTIVDTVGAGDTFNAAMIHALSTGESMPVALQRAVTLASDQCTRSGLVLPTSTTGHT